MTTPRVESLDRLFLAAAAQAPAAAEQVEWLYQAVGAGDTAGCTTDRGAYDLVGIVELWTRRRDGGEPDFHGRLLGRYWAESRTCRGGVTTHGDGFRFYEIGFRCCRDRE